MKLDTNLSRIDQIIRIAIGLGMLSMIFFVPESGYWGLLGLAPLTSAVFRHCPTYTLIGFRTYPPRKA